MSHGRNLKHASIAGARHGRSGLRALATGGRVRGPWLAVVMAVLFAFTAQSFVSQTHQHFGPDGLSLGSVAATAAPQSPDRSAPQPDLPSHCAICRAVAHAGDYLLPAPVVLATPVARTGWVEVATRAVPSRILRSHAWRSRAPPIHLQA